MAILVQERVGKLKDLMDKRISYQTQKIEKTDFEYHIGDKLKFVLIVADEDMMFKADETIPIMIKKIKIPPQTIIVSSMYGIHPIGHLSAIGSHNVPPGIIDEERTADFGMFHAALDGKISKDEVIGATIMLPVREI
jgi:hypothetical protein